MDATRQSKWLPAALVVGGVYLAAGHVFGALAGTAGTSEMRVAWRLTAWAVSAVAFAAHIRFEHVQLGSSPRATALHTSLAVALGAFALAVSASIHGIRAHHHFPIWALLVWPVLAALPAFILALVAAMLLQRLRRDGTETI